MAGKQRDAALKAQVAGAGVTARVFDLQHARVVGFGALVLVIAYYGFIMNRGEPPYPFWDENYHITSAQRYIEGIGQLEPHPPLGPMLIALGEHLSGANRNIDKHVLTTTKQIDGNDLPRGFSFVGMRLMSSLFAVLGALVFYALMLKLVEVPLQALLLSSLYVFENAFVVHFRAAHLDSFQMFFALAFFWQLVRMWYKDAPLGWTSYAALSALGALAFMVKVNAAILFVAFPLLYLRDARLQKPRRVWLRVSDLAMKAGAATAALLLVIAMTFYAHALHAYKLPDATTSAGKQDLANMSPAHLAYLNHERSLSPIVLFNVTADYFRFMDKDHKGVPKLDTTKPGENGSHPMHWPFHDRNINYRWDSADGKTAYVQLVGNQFSWYLGTAAVIVCLVLIINYRLLGIPLRGSLRTYRLIELFACLYGAFMLLHLWIITQRVMYLYHYFLGLLISYILLVLLWRYLCEVHAGLARRRTATVAVFASVSFGVYIFFLPLNNHWPLTKAECERRNISISHIVDCR